MTDKEMLKMDYLELFKSNQKKLSKLFSSSSLISLKEIETLKAQNEIALSNDVNYLSRFLSAIYFISINYSFTLIRGLI